MKTFFIISFITICGFIVLWALSAKDRLNSKRLINEFCGRLLPEVNDPNWKVNTRFYREPSILENGNIEIDGAHYLHEPSWFSASLYVDGVFIESSKHVNRYFDSVLQPFLDKIKQEKLARYNQALDTLPKA